MLNDGLKKKKSIRGGKSGMGPVGKMLPFQCHVGMPAGAFLAVLFKS